MNIIPIKLKDSCEILREYMLKPKGMFVWRDIPGYEGRYQISNHGEVSSISNHYVSENYSYVVLINIDKSRHNISRKKLLKGYWHKDEQKRGEERWKKLDHFGDYYISNYGNVKNCKRVVLWSSGRGFVVLSKTIGNKTIRFNISILKLFLNTFSPEEIFIDHVNKTVNWKKPEDLFAGSETKKQA